MPVALVTGIAGLLGSHLADRFISEGYEVRGIDSLVGGYRENVPAKAQFLHADLMNLNQIQEFFTGVDVVVHTACTAYEGLSVYSPHLVTQNTFQITASTLSASVKAGVKKIVFMSSMARYGTQDTTPFVEEMTPKPQDPYGVAKYAAELLTQNIAIEHGIAYNILVPHNIIGSRQKYDDPFRNVASIMINRMLQGKQPIIYGDGEQRRCFSFVSDVIDPIMVACVTDKADGMVVNIGPDEEFITINELAKIIAEKIGFALDPIYLPARPLEVKDANCSAARARSVLNYETKVSLEDGLEELIGWIRARGTRPFDYHLPLEFTNDKTPKSWTQPLFNQ